MVPKNILGDKSTGGKEKDRFTLQLTCTKDGGKLIPFIIFKGLPPNGRRENRSNTVAYELKHRLPDSAGNTYPPADKIYLTCNETATSNWMLTNEILEGVILPKLGVFDGDKCAILVDDFKGHSHKNVKEYVKSFNSVGDDDEY